jgi:alpha-galactosidase
MEQPPYQFSSEKRSGERGSYIVEALETAGSSRHFNVKNGGVITNLPSDAVVEVRG